ncbi:MAG: cryptochrome/photolyase family protein [Cyclobacteriaceae bacterium]
MPKTLRLILGDQLNYQHSWFEKTGDDVLYVMMEMRQETDYVKHHIQKIVSFFGAMRRFSQHLEKQGHKVKYLTLDSEENTQSLTNNLSWLIEEYEIEKFEYLLPDEHRLDEQLREFCDALDISWEAYDTEHFLTTRTELNEFFEGKKTFLMESFYRYMRKKFNVLMDNGEPMTGQWNYDHDNREKLDDDVSLPKRLHFDHDVTELVDLIESEGVEFIGNIDPKHLRWPLDRQESLEALNHFLGVALPAFGKYQDAMHDEHSFLNHSLISFSLNTKMISPLEVVRRAVDYWEKHQESISIAQIEGFVRQIIGWREYMRGIYWAKMPEFKQLNFLEQKAKLPSWYWTGDTKMACMRHAINQSLNLSYAHHIQRLMVTGNFALLAGVDPDEIDRWYLGIYIDAIEWVEITNTRGMSQFADCGIVGTKPYVSSANYINKMSNYCGSCHYSQTKKTGEGACPFNSLYWHFYNRNEDKLKKNPRIGMAYRTLDKLKNKEAILKQAEEYIANIEEL